MTIQELSPDELAAAVEPGEVTLVLGAPAIGTAQRLEPLGQPIDQLSETVEVDDETHVIVADFVSAVMDLEDEHPSDYCDERGERSLFSRAGGAVLLAHPRSFDWLCGSEIGISGGFVETVDSVVLVRNSPTAATAAIDAVRDRINSRGSPALRDDDLSTALNQARYPAYHFQNPDLQRQLGWYPTTVTPRAFLSLSKFDDEAVLFPSAVREIFGDTETSIGPVSGAFEDRVSDLVPSGSFFGQFPSETSPAVLVAAAMVAIGLDEDADWLDSLARYQVVPTTADALETALDLPPGTTVPLRVFAADPARSQIKDRLSSSADVDSVLDVARDGVGQAVDALDVAAGSLEARTIEPDEYGSTPLVGGWHWDGSHALREAADERELPDWVQMPDGSDDETDPGWRDLLDDVDLLQALDGGLVVVSGPKSNGKYQAAASLAEELTDWGTTVKLPTFSDPDRIRAAIEASPNTVVVARFGGGTTKISGPDGVRALSEWVDDGTCAGAVLLCDDTDRERLEDVAERADCGELTAWADHVEVSPGPPTGGTDRDPAVIARELLEAIGWEEVESPLGRAVEVESVTDQSTMAAIAGIPDHAMDAEFLGTVVAEAVDDISTTHGPAAAKTWLSYLDDLVVGVGKYRTADTDAAVLYHGDVIGAAMAAVALANPRTDEWIRAVATDVLEGTNQSIAHPGREPVGGDLEPFVTAFSGALARLAQPPDGSRVSHGAVGCVDEALHTSIEDGWEFPRYLVYGNAVARIVDRAADPMAANGGISTVVSRVRQHAMGPNEHDMATVLGKSFASMLGAVAGVEGPDDEPSVWIDDLDSRARDAVQDVSSPDNQRLLLTEFYVTALGQMVFKHDCPDEELGPFFEAVGSRVGETASAVGLEEPEAFVRDVYGHTVQTVVHSGDLDQAERFFDDCHRLVDGLAGADVFESTLDARAALHSTGLAAFGNVEVTAPDAVSSYPYGRDTIGFEDSLGFENWMELYEGSVSRGIDSDLSPDESTQYLTELYSDALSSRLLGFDPASDRWADSTDGVTPREEHTWYDGITGLIETRATSSAAVTDQVQFLTDVYGGAAISWAADGEPTRTQEWIEALQQTLRTSRESIADQQKSEWFDAFASTDAQILSAVVRRADVGERTYDRLIEAVLSTITAAARASDNPLPPEGYVASVGGGALAAVADGPTEEVRFGVTEVRDVLDGVVSLEWIDCEQAAIYELIYGEALTGAVRTHSDVSEATEWFDVSSAAITATATEEAPERPSEFVAGVYSQPLAHAAMTDAQEWGRRLDATVRAYAADPDVDDSAAFLERLYAGVLVEGAKQHGPRMRIEACIRSVNASIEDAGQADLLSGTDTFERTVSKAADTLTSATATDAGDYAIRLDHGLRTTGYEDIANDLFDVDRDDTPGVHGDEPAANIGDGQSTGIGDEQSTDIGDEQSTDIGDEPATGPGDVSERSPSGREDD
nr:hypothetical protein [Salinarchaeum laminariae]